MKTKRINELDSGHLAGVVKDYDLEVCQDCGQHEWTCGSAKWCGRVSRQDAWDAWAEEEQAIEMEWAEK